MQISEILKSITHATDCQVMVTPDWLQGRATFGGLVAAVGNEAMRKLVPLERPLRSLQTTFVGPAGANSPWTVRARVLRVGKAVTIAHCEIFDAGQIACVQIGIYGSDRESVALIKPAAGSAPKKVDELHDVQPHEQVPFIQHFGIRWAEGAEPFSGTQSPTKAFIRHRDQAATSESHVVALIDCVPTPALSMFKAMAPASSLVWTLELFEHDLQFGADRWWRIDTDIDAASGGYINQTGLLHDPDGRPVALTRQLVAAYG